MTGGASGIGADIVRAFAANEAHVAFIDIQEEVGHALAEEAADRHTADAVGNHWPGLRPLRREASD